MAASPRAPLRTGGYYGLYQRRGRDELKVIDLATSNTVANTGTVTLLNSVGQGTDYTQRVGRKIYLKSMLFQLDLQPTGTSSIPLGDFVRCLVVYDCQTNAVNPTVADVLANGAWNSPMNLTNRDRFKVLIDKRVSVGAVTYTAGPVLTAGMVSPRTIRVYKKMNMEMIFGATGSGIGSISTGGVFLILLDEIGGVIGYSLYSRIRFQDS